MQVHNLCASFKIRQSSVGVLKHISFEISQGSITGFIGKSGAGKTTLFRCLNGLENPDEGSILIQGQPIYPCSYGQKRLVLQQVGTVFQSFNLLSRLTVAENVALPLVWSKVPVSEQQVRVHSLLKGVGLDHKADHYPQALSGGQRQRVAIARALVMRPSLLLCDEFTSALDPETALEILSLLKDFHKEWGFSMAIITHDMKIVREICDDVYVLDQGQIVESGTLESLFLASSHPVTQGLVKNLFLRELPYHIQERASPHPGGKSDIILRLTFAGRTAQNPVIAEMVTRFQVQPNILAGNLDHLRQHAFGCLILTLPYEAQAFSKIQTYLTSQGIALETIGFLNA